MLTTAYVNLTCILTSCSWGRAHLCKLGMAKPAGKWLALHRINHMSRCQVRVSVNSLSFESVAVLPTGGALNAATCGIETVEGPHLRPNRLRHGPPVSNLVRLHAFRSSARQVMPRETRLPPVFSEICWAYSTTRIPQLFSHTFRSACIEKRTSVEPEFTPDATDRSRAPLRPIPGQRRTLSWDNAVAGT